MINPSTPSQVVSNDMKVIIQQRQILSMMGVEVWLQRHIPTVVVDYNVVAEGTSNQLMAAITSVDSHLNESDFNETEQDHEPAKSNVLSSGVEKVLSNDSENSDTLSTLPGGVNDLSDLQGSDNIQHVALNSLSHKPSLANVSLSSGIEAPTQTMQQEVSAPVRQETHFEHVKPFELLGARYGDWVILAEGHALKDEQTSALWHNLLNALSLTAETLKFPICEGISDKESANASVAGFIFRLAKRDNAKLAVVTPLPEGIDHNRLIRVPYLTEMLEDSRQKKQLWHLLSGNF